MGVKKMSSLGGQHKKMIWQDSWEVLFEILNTDRFPCSAHFPRKADVEKVDIFELCRNQGNLYKGGR